MSASPTPEEDAAITALQAALRAEYAAIHGYGFIGARSRETRARAHVDLDAHRGLRDRLRAELVERDAEPVAAESAYALPEQDDTGALTAFAVRLEETTAQAYLELSAVPDQRLRDLAARSLQSATVRSLVWGAQLAAFPGFPGGAPGA
ncbi:ferritin-like domain-containing protein [Marinactinospora thermotolerans]|uniref:ferritin-like domain-containing protein n=1 Tax=Marinactinospora thermotolerans TaxID=531310 RepID=UPI003D8B92B6